MFDILMYLFESYILGQINLKTSPAHLTETLRNAGFRSDHIVQAFQWLKELSDPIEASLPDIEQPQEGTIRVFAPAELTHLSPEARGFLIMLENSCIINGHLRELIIDRALALDIDYIEKAEIKLIVVMVLGAHSKNDKDTGMIQELLLSEKARETLH